MGIIYKATSPCGKSYIGKTVKDFQERKNEHKSCAANENSHVYDTKFSRAIRKYGFENFIWEVLVQDGDENSLYELEKKYIKDHNSFNSGYNCTEGGEGVSKGNTPWNKGKRGLQVAWNKGRKLTKQEKNKISEATKIAMEKVDVKRRFLEGMKNRETPQGENHPKPWLGKSRSEETRKKISETMKRKGLNPNMWRKN